MQPRYERNTVRENNIIDLIGQGWRQADIARKFDITPSRVGQIVARLKKEGRISAQP